MVIILMRTCVESLTMKQAAGSHLSHQTRGDSHWAFNADKPMSCHCETLSILKAKVQVIFIGCDSAHVNTGSPPPRPPSQMSGSFECCTFCPAACVCCLCLRS